MLVSLLKYHNVVVGARFTLSSCSYDLGYSRLDFWFQDGIYDFISSIPRSLNLTKHKGSYVTEDELKGKIYFEVTDDVCGCNIIETYLRDKSFDIGNIYKYKPFGSPQFESGSSIKVVDVDFSIGKVIVETDNHNEYMIGLKEFV